MKIEDWTDEDRELAGMQGWLIAGGIERVDDALSHVVAQAADGDALANKALEIIRSFS